MSVTYSSKNSFVKACFESFEEKIKSYGVSISSEGIVSIYALLNVFYDALEGNLAPKVYLNTLPPGFGKTEAIASFIKVWKQNGFHPAGGILVGLQTKGEIAALTSRLDLDPEEVAVFTRDDDINALGGSDSNTAPVLITTQQMIIKRSADRRFAKARDFFYKDGTRSLRIWDEAFVFSRQIEFTLYELLGLPVRLHRHLPNLANEIHEFATQIQAANGGDIIVVPVAISKAMPGLRKLQLEGRLVLSVTESKALDKLELAASRGMLVKAGAGSNRTLIGASRSLPDDLLPVIVTDASGSLRSIYELMDCSRGNLVRLATATADYRNVVIHLMQRACGRDAFADKAKSWGIYRHLIDEMRRRGGRWLVISYKPDYALDVRATLEKELNGEVAFDFIHWGIHHGTNAFKDAENIAVIGSYFYSNGGYEALAIAATGLSAKELPDYDHAAFRAGEFKHNMYQAVLRGSARKSDAGVASPCNVFIVASPKNNAAELLAQTFPGASIESWGAQKAVKITGHEKGLINTLSILLPLGVQEVTKKEIAQHAGFTTPQELNRQLKRPYVLAYLAREGIKVANKKLHRIGKG